MDIIACASEGYMW